MRLVRPRLALMNGVAALCGYLLYPGQIEAVPLIAAFAGVFLLAGGGSAINQAMEIDLDALMQRTAMRPLPRKEMTASRAIMTGVLLSATGTLLLAVAGGLPPALLGAGGLSWYLLIYTPLKTRTPLALLLGGLCGAVVPQIGWSLAGGLFNDHRILLLSGVVYLWQIPHFLLLQRRHAEEYRQAGIPGVSFNTYLMGVWLAALIAAAMMLPALGMISRHVALVYTLFTAPMVFMALRQYESRLLTYLNLFPLLLTASIAVQRIQNWY